MKDKGSWDLELPVPRHAALSMGSTSSLWHRPVAKTEHWVVPKPHSVVFSTHSSQGNGFSFAFPTADWSQDLRVLQQNLSSSSLTFRDCPPAVPQRFVPGNALPLPTTPLIPVWIAVQVQLTLCTSFTLPSRNYVCAPILPSALSIHSAFYRFRFPKSWEQKATADTTETMAIITYHSSSIVRWTSICAWNGENLVSRAPALQGCGKCCHCGRETLRSHKTRKKDTEESSLNKYS